MLETSPKKSSRLTVEDLDLRCFPAFLVRDVNVFSSFSTLRESGNSESFVSVKEDLAVLHLIDIYSKPETPY